MICGWLSKWSPYFLPGGEEEGGGAVSCCASRVDFAASLDLPTEDSDIAGRQSRAGVGRIKPRLAGSSHNTDLTLSKCPGGGGGRAGAPLLPPFTDLQLLDGRSLAPRCGGRRSVSSGYVGRCRSRPLPSPLRTVVVVGTVQSLPQFLARCRFMQRECAMINPPRSAADTILPTAACVCAPCSYATLSQTYPEALAVAALDPRAAPRAIVACGDG